MKKKVFSVCLLIAIFGAMITLSSGANSSVEKSDMITALRYLLFPELSKIVEEQHGEHASVDYWDIDILSIRKLREGEHIGSLEVVVEFIPFIGPHNAISKDRAILLISLDGIELLEYKIIEAYHSSYVGSYQNFKNPDISFIK